jgi:hypothetical protein
VSRAEISIRLKRALSEYNDRQIQRASIHNAIRMNSVLAAFMIVSLITR